MVMVRCSEPGRPICYLDSRAGALCIAQHRAWCAHLLVLWCLFGVMLMTIILPFHVVGFAGTSQRLAACRLAGLRGAAGCQGSARDHSSTSTSILNQSRGFVIPPLAFCRRPPAGPGAASRSGRARVHPALAQLPCSLSAAAAANGHRRQTHPHRHRRHCLLRRSPRGPTLD